MQNGGMKYGAGLTPEQRLARLEQRPSGGGGGVTDHGALTGLADDDHAQYHTDARGDARYYTQASVNSMLSGKANTAHTHAQSDVTSLVADLAAKQATITAGSLGIDKLDIDGGTDIGAALADADLLIVDDGASGANRKSAMSRVWTYIASKVTGAASSILTSNLTASRALVSDASGKVAVSAVTATQLGYVAGVTSAIQTQLNGKAPLASPALTGNPTAPTQAAGNNSTRIATTAYVDRHITDTTDAHAASAVSVNPSGLIIVSSTNVQGALAQLDAAAASGGIPASLGDAKGDLIGFSADNAPVRIPAPAGDGYQLTSDMSQASGWAVRSRAQRFKVGQIVGAVGLGSEVVTGLGFRPSLIRFESGYNGFIGSDAFISHGSWDSAGNTSITAVTRDVAGQSSYGDSASGRVAGVFDSAGSWYYVAEAVSLDSDGFTINFTVAPPAWMRIGWTAFA